VKTIEFSQKHFSIKLKNRKGQQNTVIRRLPFSINFPNLNFADFYIPLFFNGEFPFILVTSNMVEENRRLSLAHILRLRNSGYTDRFRCSCATPSTIENVELFINHNDCWTGNLRIIPSSSRAHRNNWVPKLLSESSESVG